jgi:hypothetical protein
MHCWRQHRTALRMPAERLGNSVNVSPKRHQRRKIASRQQDDGV